MRDRPDYEVTEKGTQIWRTNGRVHREDGPAVVYKSGSWRWYINGKLHRLDGPALNGHGVEGNSITIRLRWCINNHDVTDKITKWAIENNIDLDNLTEVDKALIKIVWADYGK